MIEFRPHHFMCTLGFEGKGYSNHFVKNYTAIVAQLNAEPDTLIQVTSSLDAICKACPHQTRDRLCSSQIKIEKLDLAHQTVLGLSEGQVISWRAAKQRIKQRMTFSQFHLACASCEWKTLGVCENALRKLRTQDDAVKKDSLLYS